MERKVKLVTRRTLMKAAAAGLATPALRRGAFAAEPLKVGLVYLGPIGDWGWTWAHERGRKAMVEALKGQVVADYVENVKEDASATPILKDLAQSGHKLIFATTFGYMDQTVEAAKQFPDVKFEHCTGYKHLPNLGDLQHALPSGPGGRGRDRRNDDQVEHDRLPRLLQGAGSGAGRERLHPRRAGRRTRRSRPGSS